MVVHRRFIVHEARRHLGDVFLALGRDGRDPVGGRRGPVGAHALQHRLNAGAHVADDGRDDLDIAVHFARLDVDLNELLRARRAPCLALAVREQPVQPRAQHDDDVGILENGRARRARGLRMQIGQKPLGHAHGQEGRAALFDESLDRVIGLRVGRALAENDQWALRALQHVERALDRGRGRNLRRRRVDDLDEGFGAGLGVHHLREQFRRQVEIDAAGTTRDGGANGARNADADVGGVQHAKGRLAQRLGDGELVHLLIVALLKIDDLAFRRAADENHREAVGRRVGERGQAVEEARR